MAKEKVMSHHARVNDMLVEFMGGVDTKHRLDADFWIAVRERRRGTYGVTSSFGSRGRPVYGILSSKKAARIQEKRLERLSYRGLDGLINDDTIIDVWECVSRHQRSGKEISRKDITDMRNDLEVVLGGL